MLNQFLNGTKRGDVNAMCKLDVSDPRLHLGEDQAVNLVFYKTLNVSCASLSICPH